MRKKRSAAAYPMSADRGKKEVRGHTEGEMLVAHAEEGCDARVDARGQHEKVTAKRVLDGEAA